MPPPVKPPFLPLKKKPGALCSQNKLVLDAPKRDADNMKNAVARWFTGRSLGFYMTNTKRVRSGFKPALRFVRII